MDRYWRCGYCNNKRILKCPETGRGATFNSRAEICILRSKIYLFSITPHFWLYLPNAEMTLDLEVKMLVSLASVTWITGRMYVFTTFNSRWPDIAFLLSPVDVLIPSTLGYREGVSRAFNSSAMILGVSRFSLLGYFDIFGYL
jgi:hypothetical protein